MEGNNKGIIIAAVITGVFAVIVVVLQLMYTPKESLLEEQIEVTTKKDGSSHKLEKRRYK